MKKSIADRLKAAADAKGKGIREISRETGIPASTISRCFNRNCDTFPTVFTLYTLAKYFDLSMDKLLEE